MTIAAAMGRRWRSVSFRSGLLSALSVGIVATLALFLLTVFAFVLFALTGAVAETTLVDRAEDQLLLGVDPADLRLESTLDAVNREPRDGNNAFWVVLVGNEIVNSEGEVDRDVLEAEFVERFLAVEPDFPVTPGDLVGVKTVGDQDWFYFEREVIVPDGPTYRVITAYDGTFSLWAFARSSFPVTIPIVLVLMAVAMAVTSWLTRRALRRVERMRSEVELITEQSLDRRVPTVDAADGIDKLAHTMNDMLGRLESSRAQQTQLIADASHELRSPVAGLLAQLDVAAAYPDKTDTDVLLPKLRDEAQRLQVLVDDLLFLSRSDAAGGSTADAFTTIAVDDLLAAEAAHQRIVDTAVTITVGEPTGAHVHGNPRDLARAVRNLGNNAVRHSESEVRLDARLDGPNVVLRVADDGPGVAPGDEERIFERFVRLDEARARDAGGAGLGLAIASEIAVGHGGTLRLAPATGGGATFELTLPRS